jgi:hypothetical protein
MSPPRSEPSRVAEIGINGRSTKQLAELMKKRLADLR